MKPKIPSKEDIKKKILEDRDFIKCPRSNNSLDKYLTKSKEVMEDKTIARLLMIDEKEVEEIYQDAVSKIKNEMGEEDET